MRRPRRRCGDDDTDDETEDNDQCDDADADAGTSPPEMDDMAAMASMVDDGLF